MEKNRRCSRERNQRREEGRKMETINIKITKTRKLSRVV
jgi:hypothetical protein